MGQNYSSTAAADGNARAGINIPELANVSYEKSLSSARFLKTIRARHAGGPVVIKIFAKPAAGFPLDHHRDQIIRACPGPVAAAAAAAAAVSLFSGLSQVIKRTWKAFPTLSRTSKPSKPTVQPI